jgi:hypothetical protein
MRGLKSTLALLIVLVGLGAYIYFVTLKQPADGGSSQPKVFAALATDKIDEITLKSESGDVTTVKKESGAWQIVSPVAAKAAESEISAITNALGQLEIVRVIEENPANLADFGLATPRLDVEFKTEGKPAGHLQIGEKTPTGASLYAKREDEKRVFLIAAYQETSLNRSTFELRDKTLIALARDKILGVDITSGGKTIKLAKNDNDWRITSPINARADYSTSEGILGRVETAQMKSIVADNATPADLKKYGLDKPATTVSVNLAGSTNVIALGGKADDGGIYARDVAKPMVVTVESTFADDFKKSLEDFRRRDTFEFRAFNANRAELTWDGKTLTLEKVKGEGDSPDTWKRSGVASGDADKAKVETLLTGLADIRATSFKDTTTGTGLNAPALTVKVKFDDSKKEESVTFGKSGNDVYAARPDDPGASMVEAEKLTEALKTLDELSK